MITDANKTQNLVPTVSTWQLTACNYRHLSVGGQKTWSQYSTLLFSVFSYFLVHKCNINSKYLDLISVSQTPTLIIQDAGHHITDPDGHRLKRFLSRRVENGGFFLWEQLQTATLAPQKTIYFHRHLPGTLQYSLRFWFELLYCKSLDHTFLLIVF